jgi:hypothetical protein
MRTTVVAVGAIVVAAVAAVPYFSGRMLEHEVREAVDGYNKRQSFVTASVVSYEREWLRSEFVTRLSVRDGPELARATTRVRHAPFNGMSLASGESDVHLAEAYAATEHYYFNGQTPLAMNFDIEFGGAVSGVIRSAAVDKAIIATPNTRVVVGASSGRFTIAKDKTFRFDWTLPKAAYEDPKLSVAIEGLAMSAYGQLGDDDLSERTGFKLSIASYRGAQGARQTSVRNFSVSTQMTPSTDVLRFALALRTGAGEVALDAGPHTWESFELACSLSEVQKAPVIKYSAELRNLSDVDVSESQRMLLAMRAVSELAAGLAEGEPVFAVDKLEVRTPQGNVAGSLRVSIDKARMSAGTSPWTASDGFVMSGHASISRGLAVRLIGAASGGEPAAQSLIAQLATKGVVRENGDTLEFDIAARDGIYMVNGVRATELARM